MYILDDGIRLNAQLDMPEHFEGKCPLVIVIHGFTGHMEERHITAVSAMFNEIGCATLRVDMYGHGHSGGRVRIQELDGGNGGIQQNQPPGADRRRGFDPHRQLRTGFRQVRR